MTPLEKRGIGRANWIAGLAVSGLLLCNILLPDIVGTDDLLRYYAVSMLLAELGMLYLPARSLTRSLGGPEAAMQAPRPAAAMVWSGILGVGLFFISNAIGLLTMVLWDSLGMVVPGAAMPMDGGWRIIATAALMGLVPAFAEETLFRGALLTAYLPMGRRKALLRVSLLFALLHGQPHALPSILLISLGLGILALYTGSCYCSMAAHGVYNVTSVLLGYVSSLAAGPVAAEAVAYTLTGVLGPVCASLGLGALIALLSFGGLKRVKSKATITAPAPRPRETEPEEPKMPERLASGRVSLVLTYGLLLFVNGVVLAFSLWGTAV